MPSVDGGSIKSLGLVTVPAAGTPVDLFANFPTLRTSNSRPRANVLMIQFSGKNAGQGYVGTANMNKATGKGVLSELQPGDAFVAPSLSGAVNPYDLSDFFLDADNNADASNIGFRIGFVPS